METTRFRRAVAGDAPAIAALHAESWRANYRGALSDTFLDGDVHGDRLAVWMDRLADQGSEAVTIVAEDDGVVVGFAHTVFDDDPRWGALLDNLHVAPAVKRRGIGARLMGQAAARVVERDPEKGLYLWVLEQNTAAQAFYEALGGVRVERGFGRPPGGGAPPRLRYAWSDPGRLGAGP
ncbi:MAG: GNAT family N-acetyltransferase [Acidimicrobiales bacterium]